MVYAFSHMKPGKCKRTKEGEGYVRSQQQDTGDKKGETENQERDYSWGRERRPMQKDSDSWNAQKSPVRLFLLEIAA